MLQDAVTILERGDESGNDMPLRFRLPSGLEILGLPTRNYNEGDWDLGPTWNYLVLADRPFLVDTGRWGRTEQLLEMMKKYGTDPRDLDFIILTHGHEDHDGGVGMLTRISKVPVKAHRTYGRLIRMYPDECPQGANPDFPAACWQCFMPREWTDKYCAAYHRERADMPVDELADGSTEIAPGVTAVHTPGHNCDCLTIFVGDEAVLVGDTVLPQITPWPSSEQRHEKLAEVLDPDQPAEEIFGLKAYIRSLKKLVALGRENNRLVLPAHRLFYEGQWNELDLAQRASELIEHHLTRASAFLELLQSGPKTVRELSLAHFDNGKLKGAGKRMADNEVISHLELMLHAGDVRVLSDGRFEATGQSVLADYMEGL